MPVLRSTGGGLCSLAVSGSEVPSEEGLALCVDGGGGRNALRSELLLRCGRDRSPCVPSGCGSPRRWWGYGLWYALDRRDLTRGSAHHFGQLRPLDSVHPAHRLHPLSDDQHLVGCCLTGEPHEQSIGAPCGATRFARVVPPRPFLRFWIARWNASGPVGRPVLPSLAEMDRVSLAWRKRPPPAGWIPCSAGFVVLVPYLNDRPCHFTSPMMVASSGQGCEGNAFLSGLSLTSSQPASGSRTTRFTMSSSPIRTT